MTGWRAMQLTFAVMAVMAGLAAAQQGAPPSSPDRESLDEAWWTGPMLAPSAATLPQRHFLIEPYLYDVITQGQYDRNGVRRNAPHANGFGWLTYMLYGLTDKLTVGLIPTAGFNTVSGGMSSTRVGLGDLTLQAQYRLRQFHERSWLPTISFAVQEALPTGKYDRLGDRPTDGFGSGAFTTTLALYSQTYFWLPNGRILRMRFNLSQAFSSNVKIEGASVYATAGGFRGNSKPGKSFFVDAAWEYSLTQRWVLALDATCHYVDNTRVSGYNIRYPDLPGTLDSGASNAFGLAPAIEYNWSSKVGVLIGARLIPVGRNTAATITPAVAINFVH